MNFILFNKIMQDGLRVSINRLPPPRISDKLQNIYSQQAHNFRGDQHLRKRLYSQIIKKSQQRINEKKSLQKVLNKQQNNQIDLFWRNEEERRRDLSRKRKRQIDEARRVNNSEHHNQLHKSMCEDTYALQKSFRDDLNVFIENQRKKKEEKERYFREGMKLEQARQEKKRFDKELEMMIDHKKQYEHDEFHGKRSQFYSNWKQKHFEDHHPQITKLFDDINTKKQVQTHKLQELIAVKGGQELNQRVAAYRAAQMEQIAAKKDEHVRKLKQQVEQNTYKAAIDKYLQLNYERAKMHQLNQALVERDQMDRQQKKEIHNEHLSVLRGQMKPRNLLPQPDKIEFAGIGSPAHIGKIVHQDRLKQLKYIQRNFLQQVKQI